MSPAAVPPSDLSPPQAALWWLKQGGFRLGPEWQKAHMICQQHEGDFAHDLVHALCHWIEGDLGNRDYWYRRAGPEWEHAVSIAAEWEKINTRLGGG
jgi:hypothetical protein